MNNLKSDVVCLRIPMTPRVLEAHLADLLEWIEADASTEKSEQFKRVKQRYDYWNARREKAVQLEFKTV